MKPFGPGVFLFGRFWLLIQSHPTHIIGLFRFLFLYDSVLVVCMFLGLYSFFIGYSIWECLILHSRLMIFLYLWHKYVTDTKEMLFLSFMILLILILSFS